MNIHSNATVPLAALACATAITAQSPPAAPPIPFAEATARYEARKDRPSFWKRFEARDLLAASRDARAFPILVADYARPTAPDEFARAMIVTSAYRYLADPQFAAAWAEWRGKHDRERDAWLWFRALQVETRAGSSAWQEVATSARVPAALRAAAIAAVRDPARRPDADVLAALEGIYADLSLRGTEREMLVESLVSVLDVDVRDPLPERHRGLLRAAARELEERSASTRTKIVLSRMLARILGRDDIGPDAATWLALLEDRPSAEQELEAARQRAAIPFRFFGIPEHGQSVCYVVDASDSMLTPLTAREREELQPLTGEAGGGARTAEQRAARSAAAAIDWSRVESRFDAARELLKISIRQLGEDRRFAIVLFGSEAGTLRATPRLVAAKAKTVEDACEELDRIRAGAPAADRPHGTLRGATNLHGGVLAAFCLTGKSPIRRDAGVEAKGFEDGCDAIYVLSDGAPTWDNWPEGDIPDSGEQIGDPESGTRYSGKADKLHFFGPFGWGPNFVADLERLNLLRRCAIHVVALGEADPWTIGEMQKVGRGVLLKIGMR